MKQRLTKRVADGLTPASKDAFLWDSDLPGFGLKVTPTGRKTYVLQYRLGGRSGTTKRLTLGQHGVVTAEGARAEARKLLGVIAHGVDPAAQRRSDTGSGITLADGLTRFFRDYVNVRRKPRTAAEYARTAKLHVLPLLGRKALTSIKRSDISALHHELRGKPYQANRTIALLSKFFNWAEQNGLRPEASNPCRLLEKFKENSRDRFLSNQEMMRLGTVIHEYEEKSQLTPWSAAAFRLLLLTGARLSEVLTLRWSYFDDASNTLRLPDSKTGAKVVPLGPAASDCLRRIPKIDGNPYVICGQVPGSHLVNLQKPWRRVRAAAGLSDVRLHDLRHTFASVAARQNLSLVTIGALLGHSQTQTTARYAHFASDPLKIASGRIAEEIANALGGGSQNSP
jgi:integrase